MDKKHQDCILTRVRIHLPPSRLDIQMDSAANVLRRRKNAPHLGDTSDDKVSHFEVIPRPDCANTNEFVNPFDSLSHR